MADNRNVIIINIGNEILNGGTINLNAFFLNGFFYKHGFKVVKNIVVRDESISIIKTLKSNWNSAGIFVLTGGLGPTSDDITVESVSKFLNRKIYVDERIKRIISSKLNTDDDGIIDKQSSIIEGLVLLKNIKGVAYGLYLEKWNRHIFLLPGVPDEMSTMMEKEVKNILKSRFKKNVRKTVYTSGIGESEVLFILQKKIEEKHIKKISFLPDYNGVEIVIHKNDFNDNDYKNVFKIIKKDLKSNIVSFNCSDISSIVHKKLLKKQYTLSIAESCTAGLLSKRITDNSSSSEYFLGGVVAYSNDLKMKLLNVKRKTILKYGAVSFNTAVEMAEGIQAKTNSDIAIAISGVAGPKSSEKKPAGLVFCVIIFKNKVIQKQYFFKGNRENVRKFAVQYALFELYKLIK